MSAAVSASGSASEPVRLDGATATELQRRGISVRAPEWTTAALRGRRGRAVLTRVHAAYVAAGAQVITANTFRCNLRALRRAGLDRAGAARLVRTAVGLARLAARTITAPAGNGPAGRPVVVAGSVAPVEDCYRPDLVPASSRLRVEHGWLADELVAAGVDLILVETMNCLREARIALEQALAAGTSVLVSFVAGAGGTLLSGEPVTAAVRALERDGATAVLVNCATVNRTEQCLPLMRAAAAGPIGAYPNLEDRRGVGSGIHVDRHLPAAVDPRAFAEIVCRWQAEYGLDLVGGCCGSTPEHIAALPRACATL